MALARKRSAKFWGAWATGLILSGITWICGAYLLPMGEDTQVLASLPGIGITAAGLTFYHRHWRRLDEAVQEAHKFAWFHGGGTALAILIFLVSLSFGFSAGISGKSFFSAFRSLFTNPYIIGGMTVFFAQCVGYFLAWHLWWRTRR